MSSSAPSYLCTDHSFDIILTTADPCGIHVVSNWNINYEKIFEIVQEALLQPLHMMFDLQMRWITWNAKPGASIQRLPLRIKSSMIYLSPQLSNSFVKLNDTNINYNLTNIETDLALLRPYTNFLKLSFKYSGAYTLRNFYSLFILCQMSISCHWFVINCVVFASLYTIVVVVCNLFQSTYF